MHGFFAMLGMIETVGFNGLKTLRNPRIGLDEFLPAGNGSFA
jgi:hypothetical protein